MALMSKDSGGSTFEPVPEGTHVARCVSVVDLGVQETAYGAKSKVYIAFEVPSVRVKWEKDGNEHEGPALIGSTYNNSIHEKSILGQQLTSWRGKAFTDDERRGFDLFTILDVPAMISVTHREYNGKTYAKIDGIMRLPQGMDAPPAETERLKFSPMDESTKDNFDKLPEWLQNKVRAGFRMAEDSAKVGSAVSATPEPGSAREAALKAAHGVPAGNAAVDDWDSEIPF